MATKSFALDRRMNVHKLNTSGLLMKRISESTKIKFREENAITLGISDNSNTLIGRSP